MQIREELNYHSIRLYPFDTEENDEEERQLNESIRVRHVSRTRDHASLIASGRA